MCDAYILIIMKKLILILFIGFLMPMNKGFAQAIYKGKITDENNNPIIGATIISIIDKNKGTASDFEGGFSIKLKKSKVEITTVGYQTKIVTLLNKLNIIQLKEDLESLEEVIISASREVQQRKDIPAAIGIVSEKDIEETKAFGIEQLVNQVPGVYMSSSMAASNEQHMMAIRTSNMQPKHYSYI